MHNNSSDTFPLVENTQKLMTDNKKYTFLFREKFYRFQNKKNKNIFYKIYSKIYKKNPLWNLFFILGGNKEFSQCYFAHFLEPEETSEIFISWSDFSNNKGPSTMEIEYKPQAHHMFKNYLNNNNKKTSIPSLYEDMSNEALAISKLMRTFKEITPLNFHIDNNDLQKYIQNIKKNMKTTMETRILIDKLFKKKENQNKNIYFVFKNQSYDLSKFSNKFYKFFHIPGNELNIALLILLGYGLKKNGGFNTIIMYINIKVLSYLLISKTKIIHISLRTKYFKLFDFYESQEIITLWQRLLNIKEITPGAIGDSFQLYGYNTFFQVESIDAKPMGMNILKTNEHIISIVIRLILFKKFLQNVESILQKKHILIVHKEKILTNEEILYHLRTLLRNSIY